MFHLQLVLHSYVHLLLLIRLYYLQELTQSAIVQGRQIAYLCQQSRFVLAIDSYDV